MLRAPATRYRIPKAWRSSPPRAGRPNALMAGDQPHASIPRDLVACTRCMLWKPSDNEAATRIWFSSRTESAPTHSFSKNNGKIDAVDGTPASIFLHLFAFGKGCRCIQNVTRGLLASAAAHMLTDHQPPRVCPCRASATSMPSSPACWVVMCGVLKHRTPSDRDIPGSVVQMVFPSSKGEHVG